MTTALDAVNFVSLDLNQKEALRKLLKDNADVEGRVKMKASISDFFEYAELSDEEKKFSKPQQDELLLWAAAALLIGLFESSITLRFKKNDRVERIVLFVHSHVNPETNEVEYTFNPLFLKMLGEMKGAFGLPSIA